ncbi:MAG: hypothetical protein K9J81_04625, partial [Desulfohalobiaceae bacterium]|nr:hypothetical protein [Desulfohalobiaceae bacterium]
RSPSLFPSELLPAPEIDFPGVAGGIRRGCLNDVSDFQGDVKTRLCTLRVKREVCRKSRATTKAFIKPSRGIFFQMQWPYTSLPLALTKLTPLHIPSISLLKQQ